MCGIAGVLAANEHVPELFESVVESMTDSIQHRGPDGRGTFRDSDDGVYLGHRRLAIIDVSECGRQPMASRSGRYWISFNGEIFNFQELRSELVALGWSFRGHSDTEVLLAAIEEWGLATALKKCNGMFAIALWDSIQKSLHLVRDRIGKKPLYLYRRGGIAAFSSELRAFRFVPNFDATIDPRALSSLLRYGFVSGSRSIFTAVSKVAPGCVVTLRRGSGGVWSATEESFWTLNADGRHSGSRMSRDEAREEFGRLLADAVKIRMISDVPLGAFLSGGIDSSLIVAEMARCARGEVATYSIGFEEDRFDESVFAKRVATHLGTRHSEMMFSASQAMELVPSLPSIFDEPFADVSMMPTALVSRLARSHVTVALTGDGGDELFGGYTRYHRFKRLSLARTMGSAVGVGSLLRACRSRIGRSSSRLLGLRRYYERMDEIINSHSLGSMYFSMLGMWRSDEVPVASDAMSDPDDPVQELMNEVRRDLRSLMSVDTKWYLPDDILVKVDRASMHYGLETRAPLLDYRLVEFAHSLPVDFNVRGTKGKLMLRELLGRSVPIELFDRPKQGFSAPIGKWLLSGLRDWADDLLSPDSLNVSGLLEPEPIQARWRAHREGVADWGSSIWSVLMFQAWYRSFGSLSTERA